MEVVVISNPDEIAGEVGLVEDLFKSGLENFHLRRPGHPARALRRFLDGVDEQFHNRIIVHSHHELCVSYKLGGIHIREHHGNKGKWQRWLMRKYIRLRRPDIKITAGFHTIGSLKQENPGYSYVFLSPVFNSISKLGYKGTFNEDSLKKEIRKTSFRVMALGGVDEDKIGKAKELGFHGIALLGGIWRAEDPVEKFRRIQMLCTSAVKM